MTGAPYDLGLVAHVAAAVIGFGAIGAGGIEAAAGRRSPDPARDLSLRRFFREGRDWAAAVIFLVPLLGLLLLLGGDRSAVGMPWPWIGLAIWSVAAGVATAVLWPAERRAQRHLRELCLHEKAVHEGWPPAEAPLGSAEAFRSACTTMERAAAVISVLFVAAVVVMILQP